MQIDIPGVSGARQDFLGLRVDKKWQDYSHYRFCAHKIDAKLTMSDLLNILQDLTREADTISEIALISRLILQRAFSLRSEVYLLTEIPNRDDTWNFTMTSMDREHHVDEKTTVALIKEQIVKHKEALFFPCKGKVSISSEVNFPHNIKDIIGCLVVRAAPHTIDFDMTFFLERYARRVGTGLHHGILIQYNQRLVQHILDMLTFASHDLRSPLNSIAIGLKILYKGIYGQLPGKAEAEVAKIYQKSQRLLDTMEKYLGKANIFSGNISIQKEKLDLRQDIIDPVLAEFTESFTSHGITIDDSMGGIPDQTIIISADKLWLQNVYRNLFHNVIKYGDKHCAIAYGFEDKGNYYQFNVYNSGQPIPPAYRKALFDKFSRIPKHGDSAVKGTGMGLFIIKRIIQKHGGNIWYDALDNGSNFVFTLPKE